jgi:hypothetical protein
MIKYIGRPTSLKPVTASICPQITSADSRKKLRNLNIMWSGFASSAKSDCAFTNLLGVLGIARTIRLSFPSGKQMQW